MDPIQVKEISVEELKQWMDEKRDFQLIDVREAHEFETCNLNGKLIPMGDIPTSFQMIDTEKPVVIHCRSGARSANAIRFLQQSYQMSNLLNLKGGILAWADRIDSSMPKY